MPRLVLQACGSRKLGRTPSRGWQDDNLMSQSCFLCRDDRSRVRDIVKHHESAKEGLIGIWTYGVSEDSEVAFCVHICKGCWTGGSRTLDFSQSTRYPYSCRSHTSQTRSYCGDFSDMAAVMSGGKNLARLMSSQRHTPHIRRRGCSGHRTTGLASLLCRCCE